MKKIIFALVLAFALVGVAPVAYGTADNDAPICEGTPEVLGHEWQVQERTREFVPGTAEVSHEVYSYKKKVEKFTTEHEYKKEVRTTRTHKSGHPKDQLVHDWQWWSPASIKWRDENFTESGLHGQWDDHPWKYTRVYRYTATGDTRQVPAGYEWVFSGEVTEPLGEPWILLGGYPQTVIDAPEVPDTYTDWTEWADYGDVVRGDEPTAPQDTDTAQYRVEYVGTYVITEAVPPVWQDTDPDAPCFTGPEQPGPDYFKDQGEYMTCEGLFSWSEIFEIPYVWDGDAWVPGEPVSLEHLEDKVRDLSLQERLDLGCVTEREDPEEPRNPSPEPTPLECPEGKVPGWLDEDGNPTGCVDDDPEFDEPEPTPEPAPSEDPTPDPGDEELAETGVDAWLVGLVAFLMAAAGIIIKRRSARF